MEQIATVTYPYYELKKALYTVARYVGTQQGVNFCAGSGDPAITAGVNLAITGTTDGTWHADSSKSDCGHVRDSTGTRRHQRQLDRLYVSDITGCDESAGGGAPDFITVSLPSGYPVQPIIPFTTLQTIPLVPSVKVPYGGT